MPYLDYDRSGKKREYRCTAYTLFLYEQTFPENDVAARRGITGDMIRDVYNKIDMSAVEREKEEGKVVVHYDMDRWPAEIRAFWAMLKTAEQIAESKGKRHAKVPEWHDWILSTDAINARDISNAVFEEMQRGCFRAPKAEKAEGGSGEE